MINNNHLLFDKQLSNETRVLFFAVFNILQDAYYRRATKEPAHSPAMSNRKETERLYEMQGKVLR